MSGGKKSKQAKNAPTAAEKPAHLAVCEHTVRDIHFNSRVDEWNI